MKTLPVSLSAEACQACLPNKRDDAAVQRICVDYTRSGVCLVSSLHFHDFKSCVLVGLQAYSRFIASGANRWIYSEPLSDGKERQ